MSTLKFLSNCRYIASPFSNLEDLSWRILLRNLGVHLCFTRSVTAVDCVGNTNNLFGSATKGHADRPLIVQLQPGNMDSIVQAVKELKNICDAVDITDFSSSSNSCSTDEDERWKSWLSYIHQIYQVCETPLLCKLPFSRQTVDDTIRKGKSLQEAGCQIILLHKQRPEKVNFLVTKNDWDAVKTICDSVSVPFILDVSSSSLWEIDRCIEYTGVQGIAVSDSLDANPALFCKKQPTVLDVVDQYLELCEVYNTPLPNIKQHLINFCGYYLSRFHGVTTQMADIENLGEIRMLIGELKKEMSRLSKSEMKSLLRLKRKKETFKRRREEKQENGKCEIEAVTLKEEDHVPKLLKKKIQRERVENAMKNGGQRIAIDFTLSEDMSNKEVTKLAAQVRQLYGSNMKSVSPVFLHLTGLDTNGRVYRECVRQSLDFNKLLVHRTEESFLEVFDAEDIVYLTPDSPYVLEKLNNDKVYIIGGLVDHHVLRDRSKSRAEAKNLNTARLPIEEYMERKSEPGSHSFSKVLTVNQVFDILLKFHETEDWRFALETCIPLRKGLVVKRQ